MTPATVIKSLLTGVFALCALGASAAFDPVNDDTDIFLANPNFSAQRPNVLIILDNTANWNVPFNNEKSALISVVNSLDESFNVGLMMFVETGGGNDIVDGGYVRFGVRQTAGANKAALTTMVNSLHILADKSNNNVTDLAFYEAYTYFNGLASRSGFGKVKRDYAGNTVNNPLAANLPGNAFSSSAATVYTPAIQDECQKNFIIYISNGVAVENAMARTTAQNLLQTITGQSPTQIALSPNGQQTNWADEYAKWFASADINPTLPGTQNIFTYTIEVDPTSTLSGRAMTALMRSTATNGRGKYFGVSSGGAGTAIVDALKAIFQEVQAVNSVFAASTLPVSVNVRGTNLNQVYIGVFRPDANKAPRWFGNLKMYNLGLEPSTNTVFLSDADSMPAENASTGFISGNARSFWTENSGFWSFRTPEENGAGGSSDSPDGDLVEKGGVAQQIRIAHAATQTARSLYTCTGTCATTAGSKLSDYPFATSDSNISAGALDLGTTLITSLSAFDTKAVTSLTDRKSVSLSNAVSPVTVTALLNGGTSFDVTSLTTAVSQAVTSVDARVSGSGTVNVSSIQRITGNFVVTTAIAHGFANGATVTIAGNSVAAYNNTWTVSSASGTTFVIGASGNPGNGTGGTATGAALVNSTTATVTMPAAHNFTSGQQVSITGATPAAFNGTFPVTVLNATQFSYILGSAQGLASGGISAAGNTTTATAITSAAHGLVVGNSFTISGASPADYNGTYTISAAAQIPSAVTVRFSVATAPNPNTASGVKLVRGGTTTAIASTASPHGFISGQTVQISGASPAVWNGAHVVTVTGANSFSFTTTSVLPSPATGTILASNATGTTVTATLPLHGFLSGQQVVVEGASPGAHNGTFTVLTVPNADTFTYSTGVALAAPGGAPTVRPVTATAYATVPAHGYSNGQQVVIQGATPSAYNGTFTLTVVDANTFTYSPASSPGGPNTSLSVSANVKTSTARAVAFSHGFTTGLSVTISGATPTAFNGLKTITVIDSNSFTYSIAPDLEGDASGALRAVSSGSASATLRDELIDWTRGQDNLNDENADTLNTDIRASAHGDVLHSRPAVVNYNRLVGDATFADTDVYVYYGSNEGVIRAVKGGFTSKAGDPKAGSEVWGFIPPEFFPSLNRMRNNTPPISSFNKKPYFADGTIGVYTNDANSDEIIDPNIDSGDKAWLFISMRRGGRLLYALDVSDPLDPKFMWKKDDTSQGYTELGYTWSEPKVVRQINGHTGPVLIFGAGYDPAVEDLDPASITGNTSTTVTHTGGTATRSMGRGIFIVDAETGEPIWQAAGQARDPSDTGTHTYVIAAGMDCSISSDVAVLRNQGGSTVNRGYVGDTCGNVWRLDFGSTDLNEWSVTRIASISGSTAGQRRKFLFAPDVVFGNGYDAVLMGSGDREHPFDTTVVNRVYMFKDYGRLTVPVTANATTVPALSPAGTNATLTESDLFDATDNCIQVAADCGTGVTPADAMATLASADGWYVTLRTGEKVVGGSVTLSGITFFNTNQPSASAGGGACGSNLGIAREYQLSFADATAVTDLNPGSGLTTLDRSTVHAGGGYLPTPVPVVVQIMGQTVQAVVSGVSVQQAPGPTLHARLRKFWYKEIE
ncbi:MAG: hypothetical protein ACT4PQ_12225 [Betaproteobacteria bacterium]